VRNQEIINIIKTKRPKDFSGYLDNYYFGLFIDSSFYLQLSLPATGPMKGNKISRESLWRESNKNNNQNIRETPASYFMTLTIHQRVLPMK
jgi:hypothetical protein